MDDIVWENPAAGVGTQKSGYCLTRACAEKGMSYSACQCSYSWHGFVGQTQGSFFSKSRDGIELDSVVT